MSDNITCPTQPPQPPSYLQPTLETREMIRGMVARTTPLPWCEEEVNGPRTESEIALTQAAVNAIVPALAYIDELEACLAYLFKQGGTPASVEFSKMELDSQYKEVLDNFLSHVRADAERGAI